MPDYEKMYLHMAREVEKAVRILTEVQQECEEMYMQDGEAPVIMLTGPAGRTNMDEKIPPR